MSSSILVYALKNDFAAVLIEVFFWRMQKDKLQYFFQLLHLSVFLAMNVFLRASGRVAKEVIEASSKIQREPPEVCR